jgi:hypothetical protein
VGRRTAIELPVGFSLNDIRRRLQRLEERDVRFAVCSGNEIRASVLFRMVEDERVHFGCIVGRRAQCVTERFD